MFPACDFTQLLTSARAVLADIADASDIEILNACAAIANMSDDADEAARATDLSVLVRGEAQPSPRCRPNGV